MVICNIRDEMGRLGRMHENNFKKSSKNIVELHDGTDRLDIEDILTVTVKKLDARVGSGSTTTRVGHMQSGSTTTKPAGPTTTNSTATTTLQR